MKTTRQRLAKHYHKLGLRDHPYVIEFAKELNVTEDDVKAEREQKNREKEAIKKLQEEQAKKKAKAEQLQKLAEKARLDAEATYPAPSPGDNDAE